MSRRDHEAQREYMRNYMRCYRARHPQRSRKWALDYYARHRERLRNLPRPVQDPAALLRWRQENREAFRLSRSLGVSVRTARAVIAAEDGTYEPPPLLQP